MHKRRSSLGALERALRAAEPGSHNLGQHLAEHGEYLAPLLGVEPSELHALAVLPDENVTPVLKELLREREGRRLARRETTNRDRSLSAASYLAETAVWRKNAAALDVRVLLADLLADTSQMHVVFQSNSFQVNLPRSKLAEVAEVLPKQYADLLAWVDGDGLHFRWKRGYGGLNLFSQVVPAREATHVLTVYIRPPAAVEERDPIAPVLKATEASGPQPAHAAARSTMSRGRGAWLGEILSELGIFA
jgi:hypothetical protein